MAKKTGALSPLLIWTGGSTPLLCLEGDPDLPVAPQDEAGLTKSFLMIIIHKVNATFGAFCLNINHSELITAFRTISHKIFLPIVL